MRSRLAVVAVALFAVTGCGGGGGVGEKTSESEPAGASLVRADVPVFIAATTDEDSDQWKKADALLKKFPGREQLLASIRKELSQEGVDFERDILPALGPEVDFAIFDLQDAGNSAVGMTKPDDPDKLVDLLHKGDDPPKVIKKRDDGWVVFSDSQTAVDQIGAEGDKLADDSDYEDALSKLPEESLASAWVDGKAAVQAIKDQSPGTNLGQLDKLQWAAAAVEARDDGAAVEIAAKGLYQNVETFKSSLLDKVPADTLLFGAFKGLDKSLANIDQQVGPAGGIVESFLGVRLSDLAALFSGEGALFARAGTPLPEITLALDDQNAHAKLATLDKLAAKAVASFGASGPTPVTVEGSNLKELRFGPVAVLYGLAKGWIVVTDTRNALHDLSGGGGSFLADDDTFKAAKDAAGMPDETNGFVYVNLKDAIAEISGLAGESIPPDVAGNLRPLRTLLFYSTNDGDVADLKLFVEIK
jgi:hypothetical protein